MSAITISVFSTYAWIRKIIKEQGSANVISLDESGFEPTTQRNYGWAFVVKKFTESGAEMVDKERASLPQSVRDKYLHLFYLRVALIPFGSMIGLRTIFLRSYDKNRQL